MDANQGEQVEDHRTQRRKIGRIEAPAPGGVAADQDVLPPRLFSRIPNETIIHEILPFLTIFVGLSRKTRATLFVLSIEERSNSAPAPPERVELYYGVRTKPGFGHFHSISRFSVTVSGLGEYGEFDEHRDMSSWHGDLLNDYPCGNVEKLSPLSLFGRFKQDPFRRVFVLYRALDLTRVTAHGVALQCLKDTLVFDPKSLQELRYVHAPATVSSNLEGYDQPVSKYRLNRGDLMFRPLPTLKKLVVRLSFPGDHLELPRLLMRLHRLPKVVEKLTVKTDFDWGGAHCQSPDFCSHPVVPVSPRRLKLKDTPPPSVCGLLGSPHVAKNLTELIIRGTSPFSPGIGKFPHQIKSFARNLRFLQKIDCEVHLDCLSAHSEQMYPYRASTPRELSPPVEVVLVQCLIKQARVQATLQYLRLRMVDEFIIIHAEKVDRLEGTLPHLKFLSLYGLECGIDCPSANEVSITHGAVSTTLPASPTKVFLTNVIAAELKNRTKWLVGAENDITSAFRAFYMDGPLAGFMSPGPSEARSRVPDVAIFSECAPETLIVQGLKAAIGGWKTDCLNFLSVSFSSDFLLQTRQQDHFPLLTTLSLEHCSIAIEDGGFFNQGRFPLLELLRLGPTESSLLTGLDLPKLRTLAIDQTENETLASTVLGNALSTLPKLEGLRWSCDSREVRSGLQSMPSIRQAIESRVAIAEKTRHPFDFVFKSITRRPPSVHDLLEMGRGTLLLQSYQDGRLYLCPQENWEGMLTGEAFALADSLLSRHSDGMIFFEG